jgi:hypothetical protein
MRPHVLHTVTLLAGFLLVAPTHAAEGVPSPANSTVGACLVACPLGDIEFEVVVRDLAGNPVAGSTVALDFSACAQAFLCTVPGPAPDPYTVDLATRTVSMVTNAAGLARFPLRAGGGCPTATVRVFADGVLLALRALASPDQDGDGFTSNLLTNDAALFFAKLGTADPTADLDCDADVDGDDQGVFFLHASKTCWGYVDAAKRGTWGRLKAHYR